MVFVGIPKMVALFIGFMKTIKLDISALNRAMWTVIIAV